MGWKPMPTLERRTRSLAAAEQKRRRVTEQTYILAGIYTGVSTPQAVFGQKWREVGCGRILVFPLKTRFGGSRRKWEKCPPSSVKHVL